MLQRPRPRLWTVVVPARPWRRLAAFAAIATILYAIGCLVADRHGQPPAGGGQWQWEPVATALCLLLSGIALLVLTRIPRAPSALDADVTYELPKFGWPGRVLAALALLACTAVFVQRLLATPGSLPSRLSPSMVLLALVDLAMLLGPSVRSWAALAAVVTGLCGLITLLQQLLQLPFAPLGPHTREINPAVAVCVLLLSLGWAAVEPEMRPLSLLWEPGSTGWLMRRIIPAALVFPLLLAWLRSEQVTYGSLLPPHTLVTEWGGSLTFVLISFVVFLTLVWKAATALDRLDVSRSDLQAYAHEISDLYHHAPCGYCSLDAAGRVVKINDTALQWLGYRRDEVLGRVLFADLLTPATRLLFDRQFAALREGSPQQDIDLDLRRKDGTEMAAVMTASAVRDRKGAFQSARSTLFDATQRKRAEVALRASEARNRAILASAAEAIVTMAADGMIVDFNPAAELMFGMRRSVAIELYGTDLLGDASPLRSVPLAKLAGEEGRLPEAALRRRREFTARRADGATFPAEITLTRVAGETPILFTAFIRDLTERKHAEAELRDSEERLRLLLDSTGEGIYALDLDGKCVMCNRAAVRLLGYRDNNDLLGRPIHELIHHTRADGRPYPAADCRSHLAARQGVGIEVDDEVYWRADGTCFPVEYRSYPVERAGQPVGLVVTFTDVTTRRGLESQIRQSQKMEAVGRLAAGVAHDFNNLLTVINGYTDLLLEEGQIEPGAMPSSVLERLEMVRKSGERAATLTHQLLAFSRQQVLQPQILDLNRTVRDLEPLLRRTLGENIELTVALTTPLHPVKADPSQIDQILMNLVVNARDATAAGQHGDRPGSIRVETANVKLDAAFVRPHAGLTPGAYVRLSVRDTGMGMRPETQAHVFEPFFTTKPQGQGTGLGLPTVFGIARQSGGTVVVDSTWGRGTNMQVYLPAFLGVGVAAPRPESSFEPLRAAGGPETILVVEDEDGLRKLMIEILRERGYHVLDSGHPDQALRLSQHHDGAIQLLITDIVMPAMNGRALAERMQSQRPGLRVLYTSGYAKQFNAELAFLKKPFAPEVLARKVRDLLDQPQAEAASPVVS